MSERLIKSTRRLAKRCEALVFEEPVSTTYHPLIYARGPWEMYARTFGNKRKRVLLVGMNPGPFGMVQTGVPFGDVTMVRDWMGISGAVKAPSIVHPKRPVTGFHTTRSEVSGQRLWGWAKHRYKTASAFFDRFFVLNYCPCAFVEESGRNRTPDKLPARERAPLFEACDEALAEAIDVLSPSHIVGVGVFATQRVRGVVGDGLGVGTVLHPSPASPKANAGWAQHAEADFRRMGLSL